MRLYERKWFVISLALATLQYPVVVFAETINGGANTNQPANAQTSTQQSANQAVLNRAVEHLVIGADQVAELVDNGKANEVWNGASVQMKSLIKQDQFIQKVQNDRAPLGAVIKRLAVKGYTSNLTQQNSTPAGLYYTVVFQTQFSKRANVKEMVSFRYDEDHIWRVVGYAIPSEQVGS